MSAVVHSLLISPSRRPGRFDARIGERVLVECSRTPFCDAARVLLAEGVAEPDDILEMKHDGSKHVALRAKVGVAAKLTVAEETNNGRPRFQKWTPHPRSEGQGMTSAAPRIAENEEAATPVAGE